MGSAFGLGSCDGVLQYNSYGGGQRSVTKC